MRRIALFVFGALLLAAYAWGDVYLLTARTGDVLGNLEASYIWATPTAAVAWWRFEHRHRRRERAEQARHEQRMAYLDAIDAKVDELHQHFGLKPTED